MASPNPARFTTLTSAGGSITVDTCPNAYTNLNGRLPAQLTRIQGKLAFQLNPTLPAAAANAAIAGQIQQAYLKNSIATAAATAADLIRQNAVLAMPCATSRWPPAWRGSPGAWGVRGRAYRRGRAAPAAFRRARRPCLSTA